MTIFMSYSRRDETRVKLLVQGLQAGRSEVWFDYELGGGEVWWDAILRNIRASTVFVFGVSDTSLHSKPCRDELSYARDLARPILPVQVGPVATLRASPFAEIQVLTFDPSDARSGFAVQAALETAARAAGPLPDPLPPPPQIPFAYLLAIGRQIESTELTPEAQKKVVEELRRAHDEETDESVLRDIRAMLRNLDSKPYATKWAIREIEWLLHSYLPAEEDEGSELSGTELSGADPGAPDAGSGSTGADGSSPTGTDPNPTGTDPNPKTDQVFVTGPPKTVLFDWFMDRLAQGSGSAPNTEPDSWRPHPEASENWLRRHASDEPAPPAGPDFSWTASIPVVESAATVAPQLISPPSYWTMSLLSFPLAPLSGALAMYFSHEVGQLYQAGNLTGATRASKLARLWGLIGFAFDGLVLFILLV
jgi:hypothetical protein